MTRIGVRELGYRCRHKESSRLSEIELKKRTEDGLKDIVDLHKGVASAGRPQRNLQRQSRQDVGLTWPVHVTSDQLPHLFHLSLGRHYALE
jgi:hypothetical protein